MVFWPMISTLAGISCAVRPSRLALPATTLLLSGVGAGSAFGGSVGFAAGFRAARLMRFGAACCWLPWRVAVCGFGGDTTTGPSVDDCGHAGVVIKSNPALESRTARARRRA